MAISAVPFALQNVPINADVVREAVSSLLPNGGGIVQPGDFPVAQTGTPSMAVTVGVGRAWVRGTEVTNLTGQSYSKQGQYFVMNDASVTLSIDPADSTNPRIDVVYIAIQDSAYSGPNNTAVLAIAKGFAAPTPAVPTLPNNAIAIAQVSVAANALSILNANITYLAVPNNRRHAEFTGTSDGTTGAGSAWQFNVLTKDTNNSFNDSFVVASAAKSRITFNEAGTYLIHVKVASTANPGISFASIKDSSNTYVHADNSNGNGTVWGITVPLAGLYVAAPNTDILFGLQTGNSVTAAQLTVRILVTKLSN